MTGGLTQTLLSAHVIDLSVFGGQLYAATLMNGLGGLIWRSPNGSHWTLVVPPNGLGHGEYQAFAQMTAFSDSLYVANVVNYDHHQALWKTADGLSWQPITETGLMTAALTSMSVFSDYLYMAASDYSVGAAIWRSNSSDLGAGNHRWIWYYTKCFY